MLDSVILKLFQGTRRDHAMNYQPLPILICVSVLLVSMPSITMGQPASSDVPITPWGHPDLQGVWNNNTVVPLERPNNVESAALLTDEEVAARFEQTSRATFAEREGDPGFYNEFWFEYGQDTNRTSLVVDPPDGRLPALTSLAQARADAGAHKFPDGIEPVASWTELSLFDRCITRGLPGAMSPGFYNHNYHILQTPTHVVMVVEMIHDARIIPIDNRPHIESGIRQWLGDSRGYWEDNTLVVETTNFSNKTNTRMQTVFGGSEHLRLVERFTRIDANTIDYRYTFEDATEFTAPWTASIPLNQIEGPLFEYACHEGNYAMEGILAGSRLTEATRLEKETGR